MRHVLLLSLFSLTGCGALADALADLSGDPSRGGGLPGGTATDEPGDVDTGVPGIDTGAPPVDTGTEPVDPGDDLAGQLLPVILDCDTDAGYEVDTAIFGSDGPNLWLTGIYQTHGEHSGGNHPMGYGDVFFDLPGDNVLALSSYEPVTWQLELGADAELQEILLFGYHDQIVEGAGDIPVTYFEPSGLSSCGYSLPYNGGGCDTDELMEQVTDISGRDITRFDGCYDASDIQYDLEVDLPEPTEVIEPTSLDEVILDCDLDGGYVVDTYLGEGSDLGLWVAGVYQTHSDHSFGVHPMGHASVDFDLTGDHVLVLSSYEPVTWDVSLGADAGLTEILLFGYHEQIVEGAEGVPVTFVDGPVCGYSYPDDGQGCDTEGLLDAASEYSGRAVSRYDGCYDASEFQFVSNDAVEPPEGVPCGAGETVELTIDIPAEAMSLGASDEGGAGQCTGAITFFEDLSDVSEQATWDYVNEELVMSAYNGYNWDCDSPHCNDLVYGDGSVTEDYCTIFAVCEDGVATVTGFSW